MPERAMKLQQMKFLCTVVDCDFNITEAAAALFTSQPGVSKQIRALESELGVEILVRSGNRIIGATEAGAEIVAAARRVLVDTKQLEEVAREFTNREGGRLVVATTHLHARFPLLPVITAFAKKYANVQMRLLQCPPDEIQAMVVAGEADIGVTTGSNMLAAQCVALNAYPLHRCLIAPRGHPVLKHRRPTLKDITRYPVIMYDPHFSSGKSVQDAFDRAGIVPNVVLSAIDADVIKAYVAGGLGIAVLQSLAYDAKVDTEIAAVNVDHLFPGSYTKLILNRAKYLRQHTFDFIHMVAPAWTQAKVKAELAGG
jgi:DNA-binding transcriptional LysR family regulator